MFRPLCHNRRSAVSRLPRYTTGLSTPVPTIIARAALVSSMQRRSTASGSKSPRPAARKGTVDTSSQSHTHSETSGHSHSHSHSHSHEDGHSHSHGIFSAHHHDHSEGAEQLITALSSGKLDRGTRVTLLGLGSNVVLTAGKGLAGLWMNSASLLAEAGHSLSDLLGVRLPSILLRVK